MDRPILLGCSNSESYSQSSSCPLLGNTIVAGSPLEPRLSTAGGLPPPRQRAGRQQRTWDGGRGKWCWLKDGRKDGFNMFPGRIRFMILNVIRFLFWWRLGLVAKDLPQYNGGVWKLNCGNLHHRLTSFAIPFSWTAIGYWTGSLQHFYWSELPHMQSACRCCSAYTV